METKVIKPVFNETHSYVLDKHMAYKYGINSISLNNIPSNLRKIKLLQGGQTVSFFDRFTVGENFLSGLFPKNHKVSLPMSKYLSTVLQFEFDTDISNIDPNEYKILSNKIYQFEESYGNISSGRMIKRYDHTLYNKTIFALPEMTIEFSPQIEPRTSVTIRQRVSISLDHSKASKEYLERLVSKFDFVLFDGGDVFELYNNTNTFIFDGLLSNEIKCCKDDVNGLLYLHQ